jgi:hypothetical protein
MIYLILIYFLISLICFFAGHIFYAIIPPLNNSEDNYQKPLINYLLTGLILLTGLGQLVVLFFPLNFISILGISIFLLFLFVVHRKNICSQVRTTNLILFKKNIYFLLSFGILIFMILTINAGPSIMDDTDSYHIQMIKWAQEYGSVPGIANLHLRFGFNSSWFISCALVWPKVQGINTYLVLNGLLSVWFCYYLLEKIFFGFSKQSTRVQIKVSISFFIIMLFCLWVWPMIRGNAATSNFDFITTCCILVLFIETFLSKWPDCRQEWLIWPVYLFTIRIINYPILLLTLLALFSLFKERKIRNLVFYSAALLLIIAPFIIRNTILSGYALFPIYQLDFFSFDWKVDRRLIIEILNYIRYFNRVNIQAQPITITRELAFPNWIGAWYRFLFIYDKILTTASLFSCILVLFFWKQFKQYSSFQARFFFIMILFQLASWFFIAPDPRFVYGPLLCGIFAILFLSISLVKTHIYSTKRLLNGLMLLTMFLVIFYTGRKIELDGNYRNWIIPRALPVPPARKILLDGIELNIPEKILDNWNPRCYDLALPCLYKVDPRLRARGKTISQGFMIDTQNIRTPFTEY